MDDSTMKLAYLIGTVILIVLGGLFGQNKFKKTADSSPGVEEQLNLRVAEKDKQIADLTKRIDDLEDDLESERKARAQDNKDYQQKLDALSQRFEDYRRDSK
jgi:uncharacterized protein YlxW (UPF0749 family)